MGDAKLSGEVYKNATSAWHQYLRDFSPIRPALYRYCRGLTGNPLDADDLVRETLLRGFGTIGVGQDEIKDPRAYLLRIAANAWIDWQRRKAVEAAAVNEIAATSSPETASAHGDSASVRDAVSVLMQTLAPQERAAIVLKDVFDMSLEESARILSTSIGAIKAALHRGRARLHATSSTRSKPRMTPSPAVLDRFTELYNARDMTGLVAMMLDSGGIEMMGVEFEVGRTFFERNDKGWFAHNFMYLPKGTRWERREYQREDIVLVIGPHNGRDALLSVMRLEGVDDRISRIRSYAFSPETLTEIADAFGLPRSPAMYSFLDLTNG